MATGIRAMVIRVDDEVMWVDPVQRGQQYAQGRVIGVRYERVECVEFGRPPTEVVDVELVHLRVRRPKLLAGDIVSMSTPTGRAVPGAQQGVVRPVRITDGIGWTMVQWERGHRSRHRPADLLRIPVPDQHPSLWPLSAELGGNIGTLRQLLRRG